MVNNFGAIHPNPSSTAAEFAPAVTQFARNVNGTGELGNTLCEIGGQQGKKTREAGELGNTLCEIGGQQGNKLARQANWVTHSAKSGGQ